MPPRTTTARKATSAKRSAAIKASPPPPGRTIIVLFHGREHPHSMITRELVCNLMEQLGGICEGKAPNSVVDIWIDSPGGDAHAAYKFGMYLMSRFECVNFVVPDRAKSAATLLAFCADALYMSECSELGPLDMQQAREGETQMQSALSTADAIEFLFQHAFDNAFYSGARILQGTRLSREKSISHILQFSAELFRPLMEQLDPVAIHAAARALDVTVEYGVRLLAAKQPQRSRDELLAVTTKLVRDYPTHGFIVDKKEAKEVLHLPVQDLVSYDLKDLMIAMYSVWVEHGKDFVRVTTEEDLKSMTTEEGSDGTAAATNGKVNG